ncbi:MAG: ATP-dependent DNA helicase [Oscillatoriales cyanobacterium]|nr:MAG: ATP-dependent DNA helicase [Oscillatoriales cyanobacterium]
MLEVEVHQQLRAFLRACGDRPWLHHLTVARLVARMLRSGRSVLIQGGAAVAAGKHRLSYLAPALLCDRALVLVAPPLVQQRLLEVDLARLRSWLAQSEHPLPPVHYFGDRSIDWSALQADQSGLWIVSPQQWLADRLELTGERSRLAGLPTLIDSVDDLETQAQMAFRLEILPSDWHQWRLACPDRAGILQDLQAALTHGVFQHPPNPYGASLLDEPDRDRLIQILRLLVTGLPTPWRNLLARAGDWGWPLLAIPDRQTGQFRLVCQPIDVAELLRPLWASQPIALIGSFLDVDHDAPLFQARLGLDQPELPDSIDCPDSSRSGGPSDRPHHPLTCLKLTADRHQEAIDLYLPEHLPLPNTPQFQPALMQQLHALLGWQSSSGTPGFTVLLVDDVPLKDRLAAQLAAEFGSRVQRERTAPDENGILITGWEFWRDHSHCLPIPNVLAIAALPIPSLEDPIVAARVSAYKRQRRDWFRWYLLPTALSELQRAIAPLRDWPNGSTDRRPLLALLDTRIVRRSYGKQILAALDPVERIDYLEPRWL